MIFFLILQLISLIIVWIIVSDNIVKSHFVLLGFI